MHVGNAPVTAYTPKQRICHNGQQLPPDGIVYHTDLQKPVAAVSRRSQLKACSLKRLDVGGDKINVVEFDLPASVQHQIALHRSGTESLDNAFQNKVQPPGKSGPSALGFLGSQHTLAHLRIQADADCPHS